MGKLADSLGLGNHPDTKPQPSPQDQSQVLPGLDPNDNLSAIYGNDPLAQFMSEAPTSPYADSTSGVRGVLNGLANYTPYQPDSMANSAPSIVAGMTPAPSMVNSMLGSDTYQPPSTSIASPQAPSPIAPPQVSQAVAPGENQGQSQAPINVDSWRPKKRTTLGTIADVLLTALGSPYAPFQQKTEDANMQAAMEGFTQDPENTIRRIAKLNPNKALKLQENYVDDQRLHGSLDRQNKALDMRNDDYVFQRIAGMMGAANEKNWGEMRDLATKLATQRGVDVSSIIPEQYDPDAVDFMQYGAIKPKDQKVLTETNRHNETREKQQATNESDKNVRTNMLEAGRNTRFNQGQENINARQQTGIKAREAMKSGVGKNIMTKYGPASVSPDGLRMKLHGPDGKVHKYLKEGTNWVPIPSTDQPDTTP